MADTRAHIPVDAGAVLSRFESLGDTCEFGFVQRHYGIDPISLLRWVGAPLPGLLDALRARFAGLYRRQDLVVTDGGMVLDRKYDLRFHPGAYVQDGGTGTRPLPQTEAAIAAHAQEARHVGFALRLTLDRLAARSRVFIYKTNAGLCLADILQLKAALDLYGPQRLLCVLPAGGLIAAGEVRAIATGVKIGGIAGFAPYSHQEAFDAPAWLSLCRGALQGLWGDEIVAPVRGGSEVDGPPDAASASPVVGQAAGRLFEATARGLAVSDVALARALVTVIYETLLLRQPDLGGLAGHAGDLVAGHCAVETLIEKFLNSKEFAAKAPAFLRHYVTRNGGAPAGGA